MKQISTLLLWLFICLPKMYSQNYTPFDFSKQQVWYQQGVHIDPATAFPEYFDHFFCQFDGDTVLSNQTYHKLYDQKYRNTQELGVNYWGAFRETAKRVYFFHKDSLSETLLYDFNKMNIGDTLPPIKWTLDSSPVFVVKAVGSIVLQDGTMRKSYAFGLPNVIFNAGNIVEGIGSNYGLIPVRYFESDFVYDGGGILAQVCKNHLPLLKNSSLGQKSAGWNMVSYFCFQ